MQSADRLEIEFKLASDMMEPVKFADSVTFFLSFFKLCVTAVSMKIRQVFHFSAAVTVAEE